MRASVRGTAIVLALLLPPPAPAAGAARRDLNVLLVTIDTIRADRVGCYGYSGARTPAMDRLAAEGVRFANAYAQVPLTLPSHCSILTGTYPIDHLVRNNGTYALGPDVPTLAGALKARGYATAAFVASFTLDSRFGLARGFDLYDDALREEGPLKSFRSEREAGAVLEAFTPWFEREGGGRFFAWVHFYDPHLPYAPPPPFGEEFGGRRYDGEIAYVDMVVGKLVALLEAKGLRDRTVLVVAGDHGEALGEKREIDHGLFLYDGTLKVPLIIRAGKPFPSGVVVPSRVRLVDIMPTVLDLLGIRLPPGLRGTSLVPYALGRKTDDLPSYIETFYPRENYGWSELKGLVDGRWKYILAPTPELYDLVADPGEGRNAASAEPTVLRDVSRKLMAMLEGAARAGGAARRRLTAAEAERLRSLGYLGASPSAGAGGTLADPKDRIEDYLLIFRGNLLENEGKLDEAAACYRRVLDANPTAPANHVNLALLEMKRGKPEAALKMLQEAWQRFPDSELVLSRLMGLDIKLERWEDALAVGRDLLRMDPGHFDALFLSGTAAGRLGRWDEAREAFGKALDIEPENPVLKRRFAYSLMASGRHREALAAYRKLEAEAPEDEAVRLDIGRLLDALGERAKALEVLGAAARNRPSAEAFYAYAVVLGKSGDRGSAALWMRKYLESAPRDAAARREALRLIEEWEREPKAP